MPSRKLAPLLLALALALALAAPADARACGAPAPPERQAFEGSLPLDASFLLRAGAPGPDAFELRVRTAEVERRLPATLVAAEDDAGSFWLTPDEPLPAGSVVALVQSARPELRDEFSTSDADAERPSAPRRATVLLGEARDPCRATCERGECPGCPLLTASLRLPLDAQGSPYFELFLHRAAGTSRLLLDRREQLDTLVALQARDCAEPSELTVGPEPLQLELAAVSWAGVRSEVVPLTVQVPAPAGPAPGEPADEAAGCSQAGATSELLVGLAGLAWLLSRVAWRAWRRS